MKKRIYNPAGGTLRKAKSKGPFPNNIIVSDGVPAMNMTCPWCKTRIEIPHNAKQSPCCNRPVRFSMDDHEEGPVFFLHKDEWSDKPSEVSDYEAMATGVELWGTSTLDNNRREVAAMLRSLGRERDELRAELVEYIAEEEIDAGVIAHLREANKKLVEALKDSLKLSSIGWSTRAAAEQKRFNDRTMYEKQHDEIMVRVREHVGFPLMRKVVDPG